MNETREGFDENVHKCELNFSLSNEEKEKVKEQIKLQNLCEKYISLGFAVIPLEYGRKPPHFLEKQYAHWEKYRDGSKKITMDNIKRLIEKYRIFNVAIVSPHLVEIDVDTFLPNEFLKKLDTAVIKSGKGHKILFITKEPYTSAKVFAVEPDIRLKGNLIIAPPSRHPNGSYYEFEPDHEIEKIKIINSVKEIEPLIQEILNVVNPKEVKSKKIEKVEVCTEDKNEDIVQERAKRIAEILKPYWKKSVRNQLATGLAGIFYRAGVSEETAISLMKFIANELNDEEVSNRVGAVKSTYKKVGTEKEKRISWTLLKDGIIRLLTEEGKTEEEAEKESFKVIIKVADILGKKIQNFILDFLNDYEWIKKSVNEFTSNTDDVKKMEKIYRALRYEKDDFVKRPLKYIAEIFREEILNEVVEYDNNNAPKRILHDAFADVILRFYKIKYISKRNEYIIFDVTEQKYVEGEDIIETIIQETADKLGISGLLTVNKVNEIKKVIKRRCTIEPTQVNNYTRFLPLRNGIFDKKELKLIKLDPDKHIFTFRLNIDFNEEFINTLEKEEIDFEKFVEKIRRGEFNEYATFKYLYNLQLTEEDLKKLLKFTAYIFEYDQQWQCALAIIGPGSSGKSTYVRILKNVAPGQVVSVSFRRLETNVHESSKLEDKMILVVAEPEEEWKGTGIDWFKRITGGDLIDINHKFGKVYSKVLSGKIVMVCNELPKVNFKSQYNETAFFRRWVIVKFTKQFDVDPEFENSLKNDEEGRSRLFSALLKLALPVVRKEGFSINWEENRNIWSFYTDPVFYFVLHYVSEEPGCEVFKRHVYDKFQEFLAEHGVGYVVKYEQFNKLFKQSLLMLQIKFDESYKRNENFKYGKELGKQPGTWLHIRVKGVPTINEIKDQIKNTKIISESTERVSELTESKESERANELTETEESEELRELIRRKILERLEKK